MAYTTGDIISAADYNNFRNTVNDLWNVGNGTRGYGQTPAIPTVPVDKLVESTEWTILRNRIETIALHQGTSTTNLPPTSAFNTGTTIAALTTTPNNIVGRIQEIDNNRLNANQVSVTTNVATSSRTAAWSTTVNHTFTVTFASPNDARYFFNSGGQIRFRASRSGGTSSSQNTNWSNLLSSMGTIVFDYNSTSQTGAGGSGTGIGYYSLTTSYQNIFTQNGTGVYSSNSYTIQARYEGVAGPNGSNGGVIRFNVIFNDSHTGFSDSVNGTLSSNIDKRQANGSYISVLNPSFSTTSSL